MLRTPPFDLDGYRDCLQACRERHPGLRILSGVELGEPHWHAAYAERLLARGGFERILASVHSTTAADGSGFAEISGRYRDQSPDQVVRLYLAETARLIEGFDGFEILAHIDYPVRYWPADAKRYDPSDFEEEYRHVLSRLAAVGKVLEVNTRVPLHRQVLAWWREEGGQAITFASDAHEPGALARGFHEAVRTARAAGFRPSHDPYAFWSPGLTNGGSSRARRVHTYDDRP